VDEIEVLARKLIEDLHAWARDYDYDHPYGLPRDSEEGVQMVVKAFREATRVQTVEGDK